MKINSLCELKLIYDSILNFFIDSGFGELRNITPSPALTHFVDSYNQLDPLISHWEIQCKIKTE